MAESLKVIHLKYLATDVEMQPDELYVLHILREANDFLHVLHGDSELVLCQACRYVSVGMRPDVRVYAEADTRLLPSSGSELLYDFQLLDALAVEAEYVIVYAEENLIIFLRHSSENNLRCGESCL